MFYVNWEFLQTTLLYNDRKSDEYLSRLKQMKIFMWLVKKSCSSSIIFIQERYVSTTIKQLMKLVERLSRYGEQRNPSCPPNIIFITLHSTASQVGLIFLFTNHERKPFFLSLRIKTNLHVSKGKLLYFLALAKRSQCKAFGKITFWNCSFPGSYKILGALNIDQLEYHLNDQMLGINTSLFAVAAFSVSDLMTLPPFLDYVAGDNSFSKCMPERK